MGKLIGVSLSFLGLRWKRWFVHMTRLSITTPAWWADGILLTLDLLMVFDLYEWSSNILSTHTRRLRPAEVQMLQTVYGDALPYHRMRIDEYARLGPKQKRFCYVSFHTINSWGTMSDALLVHEAMHVFQYAQVGAAYIGHSVRAWSTEMGYDYGGGEYLRAKNSIWDFNYEQQADIMADAYRLMNHRPARWHPRSSDMSDFEPYLKEVSCSKLPRAYQMTVKG
ncbi:MAG: hypothetical protein AAF544_00745 [Bacteroidota bacterium]